MVSWLHQLLHRLLGTEVEAEELRATLRYIRELENRISLKDVQMAALKQLIEARR